MFDSACTIVHVTAVALQALKLNGWPDTCTILELTRMYIHVHCESRSLILSLALLLSPINAAHFRNWYTLHYRYSLTALSQCYYTTIYITITSPLHHHYIIITSSSLPFLQLFETSLLSLSDILESIVVSQKLQLQMNVQVSPDLLHLVRSYHQRWKDLQQKTTNRHSIIKKAFNPANWGFAREWMEGGGMGGDGGGGRGREGGDGGGRVYGWREGGWEGGWGWGREGI